MTTLDDDVSFCDEFDFYLEERTEEELKCIGEFYSTEDEDQHELDRKNRLPSRDRINGADTTKKTALFYKDTKEDDFMDSRKILFGLPQN